MIANAHSIERFLADGVRTRPEMNKKCRVGVLSSPELT